jgi:hypothetical protein
MFWILGYDIFASPREGENGIYYLFHLRRHLFGKNTEGEYKHFTELLGRPQSLVDVRQEIEGLLDESQVPGAAIPGRLLGKVIEYNGQFAREEHLRSGEVVGHFVQYLPMEETIQVKRGATFTKKVVARHPPQLVPYVAVMVEDENGRPRTVHARVSLPGAEKAILPREKPPTENDIFFSWGNIRRLFCATTPDVVKVQGRAGYWLLHEVLPEDSKEKAAEDSLKLLKEKFSPEYPRP